jgi:hypothetical protein
MIHRKWLRLDVTLLKEASTAIKSQLFNDEENRHALSVVDLAASLPPAQSASSPNSDNKQFYFASLELPEVPFLGIMEVYLYLFQ